MPKKEALLAGQTCRTGRIEDTQRTDGTVFNLHAYADTFSQKQRYDLSEEKLFFMMNTIVDPPELCPLGRTYRKCTGEERRFVPQQTEPTHPEVCAVVGGAKFDSQETDFHQCLDSIVGRGMVVVVMGLVLQRRLSASAAKRSRVWIQTEAAFF